MEFLPLLERLGVPVFVLVIFAWGVWRVVRWCGDKIILPIRDHLITRVVNFFDRLDKTADRIEHTAAEQAKSLRAIETAIANFECGHTPQQRRTPLKMADEAAP